MNEQRLMTFLKEVVTLAHDRNEVSICGLDAKGASTISLDYGRKKPKTLTVIATMPFQDVTAWRDVHMRYYVPFPSGSSVVKAEERRWLRANMKGLWSFNLGGEGVHFADQIDGFWYRMYRG